MITRDGLGEDTEFARFHPLVSFMYFALAIGITMFSMSVIFLSVTFVCSWIYSVLLKGVAGAKENLIFTVSTLVIMALINTFFTHNGATVLFYINNNRITMEAFVYGICAAVMLVSVIIWFSCFNVIMTADKLIYLFGKAAPVLGLTMSMIFRFIPLLKNRFKAIFMGQRGMGREKAATFTGKARQLTKETSILIAWSLESSIESADSMEARGYGLRGRTSFNLFKLSERDILMLAVMAVLGGICIYGCVTGITGMYYYPEIEWPKADLATALTAACYAVLLLLPAAVDIIGEIRWKRYA